MIYGENSQSIRYIMGGLADQVQWMKLIRNDDKAYSKLIDYLVPKWGPENPLFPNDVEIETVAFYAGELNEKPATVNKWFRQIYNDIFDLNEKHPELFATPEEHLCSFIYNSKHDKSGFWFNLGVRSVPRVGDCFSFYFARAVTDTYDFVVKDVTHRSQNGRMEIEIELADRYYGANSYRNLLIEKARFLRLISIEDLYDSDYHLNDKLLKIFKSDRFSMI